MNSCAPHSSRLEPVSSAPTTPLPSSTPTPDTHPVVDTLSEQDEGTLTPSSKQTSPTTSPSSCIRSVGRRPRTSRSALERWFNHKLMFGWTLLLLHFMRGLLLCCYALMPPPCTQHPLQYMIPLTASGNTNNSRCAHFDKCFLGTCLCGLLFVLPFHQSSPHSLLIPRLTCKSLWRETSRA